MTMEETSSPSFLRRILAVVVLVIAVWFLIKVVLGLIAWLATLIVIVGAIAAVIWAVRTL
jgi:small-conductance mechanosensitive channel